MDIDKQKMTVVGAGPAGLSAAINLALKGREVEVYDKRSDTGKRFHGDLQGLENWSSSTNVITELTNMNIKVNFDCAPLGHLIITNGKVARYSRYPDADPLCYLVKRGAIEGSLDQGLRTQAEELGIKIHFNQTIDLDSADVIATGPISREQFAVDKGIVFRTNAADLFVFLVNDDAAYKGYSYVLITGGYGCMCTVLFDRFGSLNDCYERSEEMLTRRFSFDIRDSKPVAGIGCFSTKNIFRRGNAVYVGEAAGIQDLMWGFGIRTAVQSGYLAANCLTTGQDYEEAARAFFAPKLKATLTGRFLWELVRFNNYSAIVNNRFRSSKAFNLTSLYNFSPLQRLLYPIARTTIRRRYPALRL